MTTPESEAYIAFGSNVGDQRANLRQALKALDLRARIVACSPLYATEPVGYLDQGWFLNGVALVATQLGPSALLAHLHEIEQDLGRERRIRNGPRTIDLDILYWRAPGSGGQECLHLSEPGLTIPHPRAQERLFVVAPWADLAPWLKLPLARGKTLEQLREDLAGSAEVVRHSAPPW